MGGGRVAIKSAPEESGTKLILFFYNTLGNGSYYDNTKQWGVVGVQQGQNANQRDLVSEPDYLSNLLDKEEKENRMDAPFLQNSY